MEAVKQRIKDLLEHHDYNDQMLKPVLASLRKEAVEKAKSLIGAWADMYPDLLLAFETGDYRRTAEI